MLVMKEGAPTSYTMSNLGEEHCEAIRRWFDKWR